MDETHFKSMRGKIKTNLCPMCQYTILFFQGDYTNMFNKVNPMELQHYRDINVPIEKYYNIECNNCGYVLKFNVEKLIR